MSNQTNREVLPDRKKVAVMPADQKAFTTAPKPHTTKVGADAEDDDQFGKLVRRVADSSK